MFNTPQTQVHLNVFNFHLVCTVCVHTGNYISKFCISDDTTRNKFWGMFGCILHDLSKEHKYNNNIIPDSQTKGIRK